VSVEIEMTPVDNSTTSADPTLWLLPLLLAASGCAALIYEVVWLQLLQLVIGSSAVSLGLLLAAYMGGLCLGSVAFPRVVSPHHHPLRVYACLELGIAVCAVLFLFAVPVFPQIWHGTVAAACLIPPTMLMGASFPAISRWLKTTPQGVSWLGSLYTANIAGAITGCLLAGFYLLRVLNPGSVAESS
jgi:spermidine synthase